MQTILDEILDELEHISASNVPPSVANLLQQGQERQAIRAAIAAGNRNESQLSDIVFFYRHPERKGRLIQKNEPNFRALSQEWLFIRDQLVRPELVKPVPIIPKPIVPPPRPIVDPDFPAERPRVVFIPGLMGSRLGIKRRHRLDMIWDPPKVLGGIDLADLKKHGNGYDDGGGVGSVGIIRFGGIYEGILHKLRANSDLLEFSHDWRLSNSVSAQKLGNDILAKWPDLREGHIGQKVIVITHSMGGLVARYLIEALQGHRCVQKLIAVGAPNLGAPEMLFGVRLFHRPKQKLFLNRYASMMELLPVFDFIFDHGVNRPYTVTYEILSQQLKKGALKSNLRDFMDKHGWDVNDLINKFRSGLINDPVQLNDWLQKKEVEYTFVGSTGLKTEKGFELSNKKKIFNLDGDGTVPLNSALWFPNLNNQTNIKRKLFQQIGHRDIFKSGNIQQFCLQKVNERA